MNFMQHWRALTLAVGVSLSAGCAFDSGEAVSSPLNDTEPSATADQQQPVSTYGAYGWVLNTVPGANSTPSTENSFNSAGGVNRIERIQKGEYAVYLPKLGTKFQSAGMSMVTAYTFTLFSAPTTHHCNSSFWPVFADEARIGVNCFDTSGARADSMFVASIFDPSTSDRGGYVAVGPSGSGLGINSSYSWNSAGGTNTFTSHGDGDYTVSFPGVGSTTERGTAHAEAIYGSADRCKVQNLTISGTTANVRVACRRPSGTRGLSYFSVVYTRSSVPTPGAGAYLRGNQPTTPSYPPDPAFSYSTLESLAGSAGQPKADRAGVGVYGAIYPRMPWTNRVATHATAFGTSSSYCINGLTINHPATTGSRSLVYCFTPTGAPVDTEYMHQFAFDKVIVF